MTANIESGEIGEINDNNGSSGLNDNNAITEVCETQEIATSSRLRFMKYMNAGLLAMTVHFVTGGNNAINESTEPIVSFL